MTKYISLIVAFTIGLFNLNAQETDEFTLEKIIQVLADSSLQGRRAGSNEAKEAAEYLASGLKSSALSPFDGSFIHTFRFKDFSRSSRQEVHNAPEAVCQNVIGFLDNHANKTILIGAHYDHLGKGKHINSRSTSDSAIHFGADDNASGVAVTMEIIKELTSNDVQENYNVIVAFFSAEEIGLLGSKAWLNNNDSLTIDAMLNLDMVGRMRNKTVQIYGYGTSADWNPFVKSMDSNINWEIDSSGLGPSDHATFYLDSIPVLHFFTGQHEDYHRETDLPDKLNYKGMHLLTESILDGLTSINSSTSFSFLKTRDKTNKKRPKLKVTLGIMPSYSTGEEGLLIDGVIEGKSAHSAGILKGDQIIQIGNQTVKDIYDYMDALSIFEKGDTTTVYIKRNKEILTLNVKFK